jgi:predicted NUDIX family NTP pyrophosphohydrolase
MTVLDNVRIIIYRVNAKGLEILLLNEGMDQDPDIWGIPQYKLLSNSEKMIWLEETSDNAGNSVRSVAIEADWHDIPSVRGIIKYDVKLVKSKIKSLFPQLEKGTYFTIKEAFKKVLPEEYKALKELKDIMLDRNLTNNI